MRDTSSVLPVVEATHQEPFERIVPLLKAALLLGVSGSFGLAAVLTLTREFALSTGLWWFALTQAQGNLQLYGWAGLFIIGIAFHFLPRLCGTPLPLPWLVPWIVATQGTALLMCALGQPLLAITGGSFWRMLLLLSGILEGVALITVVLMFMLLLWRGLLQAPRPALRGMLPFLLCAFISLPLAALVNLTNMAQAGLGMGLVQSEGDSLHVVLGLFGFLIPIVLALSIRLLPMYAGLGKFPQQIVWPLVTIYLIGLALTCIGVSWMSSFPWLSSVDGLGMVLLSVALLVFAAIFLYLMYLPKRLPSFPQDVAQEYQARAVRERDTYGSYVRLIASAYLWVVVGALLLASRGVSMLIGTSPFVSWDIVLHSFASGFIALLLSGLSVRILPGFSGKSIAGFAWVAALFWLANTAALLHVGSMLLLPVLVSWGRMGFSIYAFLFGISGPVGLAFAVCLMITLWPVLRVHPQN